MTPFALRIQPYVHAELDAAASAEAQGRFHTAFAHLERAHVLGQRATVEHVRVHWRMFRFALRNRFAACRCRRTCSRSSPVRAADGVHARQQRPHCGASA
jgi:hypothetical protein